MCACFRGHEPSPRGILKSGGRWASSNSWNCLRSGFVHQAVREKAGAGARGTRGLFPVCPSMIVWKNLVGSALSKGAKGHDAGSAASTAAKWGMER